MFNVLLFKTEYFEGSQNKKLFYLLIILAFINVRNTFYFLTMGNSAYDYDRGPLLLFIIM